MIDDVRRENGSGSIRHRKDGRWEARLRLDSGRMRSYYARTEKEARAKLDAARRDLDIGIVLAGPRLTVAHYLRDWLIVSRTRIRPSTHRRYVGIVERNILPVIGHLSLVKLTPTAVERMCADALASLSPRTVHHMRAVLRTALARAVKHGLVARNVAALADPVRVPHTDRPVLTPEQALALLRAVSADRLAALYWLAVSTGLRLGELMALRWSDVDLEAGTLRVSHAAREAKTEGSARSLGLPAAVIPVLRRHAAEQEMERRVAGPDWHDRGLVFTRPDGQPLYGTLVHREWRHWRKVIGAQVRFHDLRHSAASLMLAQGSDVKEIQVVLGHSNIRTTAETYTHVLPDMKRAVAERMSRWLEGVG